MSTKVEEARLRRMAMRQNLILRKSRRRDPMALDFGRYALIDWFARRLVHPDGGTTIYVLTIEDVRNYLETDDYEARMDIIAAAGHSRTLKEIAH